MKKFVVLMFIIISNIAFTSSYLNEAEFSVRLNLIEPISLKVDKHMEFGVIEKGIEKQAEAIFTLKGEMGKNYNVIINNSSELVHTESNENRIPVALALEQASIGKIESLETQFTVVGKANYAKDTQLKSGEYQGTIVVRVNYN